MANTIYSKWCNQESTVLSINDNVVRIRRSQSDYAILQRVQSQKAITRHYNQLTLTIVLDDDTLTLSCFDFISKCQYKSIHKQKDYIIHFAKLYQPLAECHLRLERDADGVTVHAGTDKWHLKRVINKDESTKPNVDDIQVVNNTVKTRQWDEINGYECQLTLSNDQLIITVNGDGETYQTQQFNAFDMVIVDANAKSMKRINNLSLLDKFEYLSTLRIHAVMQIKENQLLIQLIGRECINLYATKVETKEVKVEEEVEKVKQPRVVKSLDQCTKDYNERYTSIKQLIATFEKYPKSYAALNESFWRQFFADHNV